jgi:hypothetical protein
MNGHDHVIELRRLVARMGWRSNGKALAVGHGGTVEVRGGTPATVSPYRLNRTHSKLPGSLDNRLREKEGVRRARPL